MERNPTPILVCRLGRIHHDAAICVLSVLLAGYMIRRPAEPSAVPPIPSTFSSQARRHAGAVRSHPGREAHRWPGGFYRPRAGLPRPFLTASSLVGGWAAGASQPAALQWPGGARYQALSCRVPSGRSPAPWRPPRSLPAAWRCRGAALQAFAGQGSDRRRLLVRRSPAACRPPAR